MNEIHIREALRGIYKIITNSLLSASTISQNVLSFIDGASDQETKIRLLQFALKYYSAESPVLSRVPSFIQAWANDYVEHKNYTAQEAAQYLWESIEGLTKKRRQHFLMHALHFMGLSRAIHKVQPDLYVLAR